MQRPAGRVRRDAKDCGAEPESSGEGARSTTALRAGDHAPDIRLSDASGQPTSLIATLKYRPAVVSFLSGRRGTISGQLSAVGQHLDDIETAGGVILAVTPIVEPAAKYHYGLKILHDAGSGVASAYGLCPPPINSSSAHVLAASDPADHGPIPATFVVDQRSRIILSLTDAPFDNNLVPTNVVSVLNALRRRKGRTS